MPALEMHAVSKTYARRGRPPQRALDGLELVVGDGGVHGLLGPNGSGKTTMIRIALGLVRPDSGEVRLLGRPVPSGLPEVIGSVGALVETPLFFPGFTGRRNLRLLAETAGLPRTRVEEVLEVVELRDRADDRFAGYSLGMKQRLAIAAALLKAPQLLVLDEPGNGLDPGGMRDVRDLVRRLGREGTTVLISSHLLTEIQQVADSVSIMARGRCIASGPVHEVLAGSGAPDVRVRVPDPAAAATVLTAAGYSVAPAPEGGLLVHAVAAPAQVTRLLAESGHWLEELTPMTADLESAFLALTAERA
ncbi:ABC transporter ATP-binding protein [Modestobacter sp. SYSU DS0290]